MYTWLRIDQNNRNKTLVSQDLRFKESGVDHFLRLEARPRTDPF